MSAHATMGGGRDADARGCAAQASAAAREGVREDRAAEQSRRAFFRQLKRVVESSDVILQVLDARDPLGCRARDVELAVLAKDPHKRIVLVLNKIDLVPKEVVKAVSECVCV